MPIRKRTILFPFILIIILTLAFTNDLLFLTKSPETTATSQHKVDRCLDGTMNKEETLNIVGLGDSLTAGVGDESKSGGYIGNLEKKLAELNCFISIKNYSKSGYKSSDLVNKLKEDRVVSAIEEAEIVLFTIGANDLVNVLKKHKMQINKQVVEKAQKEYAKHIKKILTDIRSINEDVLIYAIGFYNPLAHIFSEQEEIHSLISTWNETTKDQVSKVDQAYFVPVDDLFTTQLERLLAEDLFHPNYLGYKTIAERLLIYLQRKGE